MTEHGQGGDTDLIFTDYDEQLGREAVESGIIEFDFYKRLVRLMNVGESEDARKVFTSLPDPLKVIMPEKP